MCLSSVLAPEPPQIAHYFGEMEIHNVTCPTPAGALTFPFIQEGRVCDGGVWGERWGECRSSPQRHRGPTPAAPPGTGARRTPLPLQAPPGRQAALALGGACSARAAARLRPLPSQRRPRSCRSWERPLAAGRALRSRGPAGGGRGNTAPRWLPVAASPAVSPTPAERRTNVKTRAGGSFCCPLGAGEFMAERFRLLLRVVLERCSSENELCKPQPGLGDFGKT